MTDRWTRRDLLRALGVAGIGSAAGLPGMANSQPAKAPADNGNKLARDLALIHKDRNLKWKGSPLGNQYPLLKRLQQEAPHRMAYLNARPKDLETWKKEVRAKIFDLLHYRPKPCDPQAKVHERLDKGDYIREYLHFNTTPDIRVGAYLFMPKKAKFPVPGVVALHDHGGFYYWGKEKLVEQENENPVLTAYRKRYYDGISYPATLARNGYAVIVIDMFYFGERRLILDSDLAKGINTWSKMESEQTIHDINYRNGHTESWVDGNVQDVGVTWGGILYWDDIRTLDYLASRPEVDPKRLACVGLSVGGWRSNFLAGLDGRIKAAVVAGWMTSFEQIIPWFVSYTIPAGNVPGLFHYLDYPDVGSLLMPGAMLVVHGLRDALFPPEGVKSAFRNLSECYHSIGKPERFSTYEFDGPHSFPAHAQKLMLDWFNRWV